MVIITVLILELILGGLMYCACCSLNEYEIISEKCSNILKKSICFVTLLKIINYTFMIF